MIVRPLKNTSSIARCTAAYRRSGNASLTGMPLPSLPPKASTSSLHLTMTCMGPRNSATAGMAVLPTRLISLASGLRGSNAADTRQSPEDESTPRHLCGTFGGSYDADGRPDTGRCARATDFESLRQIIERLRG